MIRLGRVGQNATVGQRRKTRTQIAASLAVLLAAGATVALLSYARSSGAIRPAAACFPAPLQAEPAVVHPGQPLTVRSGAAACRLGYAPRHAYSVTLQHRESVTTPISVDVTPDGRFRATIDVPATFPRGDAVVIVTGSPYDRCEDSGSCVGYSVTLVVD